MGDVAEKVEIGKAEKLKCGGGQKERGLISDCQRVAFRF